MTNDDNRYEHSSYDRTKPSSYDGFGGRESRRNHTDDQDFDISRMNDRDRHRSVRGGRRRDRDGKPFGSHDYNRHRDSERGYKGRRRSLSRERFRNQSRSPSRSPPRLKSKRSTGFDMGPPTPTTMSGISISAQLPGVPQAMPTSAQNMFQMGLTPLGALALMPAHAMTQQATRHARRVYVGGLPPMANEQIIAIFFSQVMAAIGGNSAGSGDAVVNVYINHEKKFAFVEMRTVEEASNAMALDGIVFEGVAVRVRRPTDYNPTLAATLGPSQPSPHLNLAAIGLVPSAISAAEGKDRIFVGGIPYYIAEAQIRELLESFGPLKGFDLVKDRETGNSRGYGFCVYQDPAVTIFPLSFCFFFLWISFCFIDSWISSFSAPLKQLQRAQAGKHVSPVYLSRRGWKDECRRSSLEMSSNFHPVADGLRLVKRMPDSFNDDLQFCAQAASAAEGKLVQR